MSMQIEKDSEWNPYAEHEQTIRFLRYKLAAAQAREAELIAHVERLREALEYSLQAWKYDGVSDEHGSIFAKADSVCDATPAQSLASLRNEALDNVLDLVDAYAKNNTDLRDAIRAMKELK